MGRGNFKYTVSANTSDAQRATEQLAGKTANLDDLMKQAKTAADNYAKSVTLTSKEASALGKTMGLTAGEVRKLVAAEQLGATEARKLAQAQLENAKNTRSLGDAANSTASDVRQMADGMKMAAGALAASQLAQAAADLYELGLASRQVNDSLNALTGGQADEYINAIQAATKGTVDEMSAAQIASQLYGMGLVDTSAKAAEMARVATILGGTFRNMGAAEASQEFAIMMANMSVQRLDSFGISSGAVRARIDELLATVPGLTREMAFYQATMEIASESADTLAGNLDNQSADLQRIEASWQDAKVAAAEYFTEVTKEPATNTATAITGLTGLRDATRAARIEIAGTATGYDDFREKVKAFNAEVRRTSGWGALFFQDFENLDNSAAEFERLRAAYEETQGAMEDSPLEPTTPAALMQAEELAAAIDKIAGANQQARPEVIEVARALQDQAITGEEARERLTELNATAEELASGQQYLTEQTRAAEQSQRDYARSVQDTQREHAALADLVSKGIAGGQGFLDFLKTTGNEAILAGDAFDDLREKYGLATAEQILMEQGLRLISSALDTSQLDAYEAAAVFEAWTSGSIANIDDLKAKLGELTAVPNPLQPIVDRMGEADAAFADLPAQAAAAGEGTAQGIDPANEALKSTNLTLNKIESSIAGIQADAPLAFEAMSQAAAAMLNGGGGLLQASGIIADMRADWAFLLNNPNANLHVDVTGDSIPQPGGGGGGTAGGGNVSAGGSHFMTSGPMNLTVGDNPGGVEEVIVRPVSGRGVTRFSDRVMHLAGGGTLLAGGPSMGSSVSYSIGVINLPSVINAADFIPELQRELRAQGLQIPEAA